MLNCTAARASTFILKAKPIPPHEFYRVILFLVLTKYPLLFFIPLFTHAIKSRGSKYLLFYRTTHRLQIGASGRPVLLFILFDTVHRTAPARGMREQNCRNARQPANEHRRVLAGVIFVYFNFV